MESYRIFMLVVLAIGIGRARYVPRDPSKPYGTFWDRFFAAWLDGIVMWPLNLLDARIVGSGLPRLAHAGWFVIYSFTFLCYQMFCHARWGQTLGKWCFGVCVFDVSEVPLRPVQAVKRDAIALVLTGAVVIQQLMRGRYAMEVPKTIDLISAIGASWRALEILTMMTNRKRRALHDLIAGSVVVRVALFRRRRAVEQAVEADDPAAGTLV
jgi:uncharacterized RDD family membrane protein YckC